MEILGIILTCISIIVTKLENIMSRAKWEERVEYIEVTADDSTEKCKIIVSNGGNGDLYVTVCPKDHRGGHTVRIERSGGASTKNPLPEALASELVEYREAVGSDELLLSGKKYTLREAYKYLLACPFLTNVHEQIKNQIDCDVLYTGLSIEYQIGYVLDKKVAFGIIDKEFVDIFYSRVDTLEYQFGKYSCFDNGQYQRSIREVQKKILNHKPITYE